MEEKHTGLTTLGVFSLGAGAMISSGLFILPAIAFSRAGVGVLVSYFLAGLAMLPAIFTRLELASAMPKSGGAFFYLTRIFGAPVGMSAGFADWFSIALKSAFALVGIGFFGSILFPHFGETEFKLISVVTCVFFVVLNLVSVEGTGRLQSIMVVGLIAILAVFIVVGYRTMDFEHYTQAPPLDALNILGTVGMVFVSYGGITKITSAMEEIKNPKKMLVPGMLAAFVVVQALYLLVIFVIIGVLDSAELTASLSPLTDAAFRAFPGQAAGTAAVALIAVAGLLAFFTTANAGILSASRVPMAMSRDGMLPEIFGRLSRKGTPVFSIVVTGVFMIVIILGLEVELLAKVASLFLILVFLLENIGIIIIRYSRLSSYRPIFRSPLFPVIQIIGILLYGTLIAFMGWIPLAIAAGIVAVALVFYAAYGRKGWAQTSALITMIERGWAKDFAESPNELEDELLGILIEREQIEEDRFDSIVREALVIDYRETVDMDRVFTDAAALLAERYALDPYMLKNKFRVREDQTSTLIYPGVAIPHAIPHAVIEGNSIFDVVLVRNRFGIKWTKDEIVYTAFCMIGTKDERNFHLRALMSIAQTLKDPLFHRNWHEAKSDKALKTALLLSGRHRESASKNEERKREG